MIGGFMASKFVPLNGNDTKELRKELGLPVTKDLVYWYKDRQSWKQCNVIDYEIVATYQPSGSRSLLITLESGQQVRILADYLVDMQSSSFINDVGGETERLNYITGKMGKRIEGELDTYVVVDLETTGKNHFSDEITEIGAIKYVLGKEVERFNVLVKTEKEIPLKIEKLTGISNDMLRLLGTEPKEAYESFKSFVGNDVIVGHNFTTFDSKFLEDAYIRELNCHFPNDYIDTLYLARKALPDLNHHNLECLSEVYNIDYSKAHRAIEDCVINHLIYEYLSFGRLLDEESSDIVEVSKKDSINCEKNNENDLVEVDASEGWKARLSGLFPSLTKELTLMDNSLSIMAHLGKDKQISSYAVCVYEPDLVEDRRESSRNTVLARVKDVALKSNPNLLAVESKNPGLKKYGEVSEDSNGRFSIRFDKDSDELVECLVDCIRYGINNYIPKAASFGCCARYEECSKAKKCVHTNFLYAKACEYRKNLENGHIFY